MNQISSTSTIQFPTLIYVDSQPIVLLISTLQNTTIYLILPITLAILAVLGVILVIKNKATIPEFAIVGGVLLPIAAVLTFLWNYGLLILIGGFPIVAYSLYQIEPLVK